MGKPELNLNLPWKLTVYGAVHDASDKIVEANGFASIMAYSERQKEAQARSALIVAAVNAYNPDHTALIADLVGALSEVSGWINNWSPDFVQDDEWPATADRMEAALARAKALEAQP